MGPPRKEGVSPKKVPEHFKWVGREESVSDDSSSDDIIDESSSELTDVETDTDISMEHPPRKKMKRYVQSASPTPSAIRTAGNRVPAVGAQPRMQIALPGIQHVQEDVAMSFEQLAKDEQAAKARVLARRGWKPPRIIVIPEVGSLSPEDAVRTEGVPKRFHCLDEYREEVRKYLAESESCNSEWADQFCAESPSYWRCLSQLASVTLRMREYLLYLENWSLNRDYKEMASFAQEILNNWEMTRYQYEWLIMRCEQMRLESALEGVDPPTMQSEESYANEYADMAYENERLKRLKDYDVIAKRYASADENDPLSKHMKESILDGEGFVDEHVR